MRQGRRALWTCQLCLLLNSSVCVPRTFFRSAQRMRGRVTSRGVGLSRGGSFVERLASLPGTGSGSVVGWLEPDRAKHVG